tara:strand:+ start:351 stop:944 length:594 start_codon:yes stop_codon:yes gene_type:complete
MVKTCPKCGVEKERTDFNKNKSKKDGLQTQCKQCRLTDRQKPEKREKKKEYDLGRYQTEEYKEYRHGYNRRDDVKKRHAKNQRENRQTNPEKYIAREILSNTIKRLDTTKSASTDEMNGYSADELNRHLSALNENWRDYEIDHKIPVSWFKKGTPIHIINDLRNLQPLSAKENRSKNNRYADDVPEEYKEIVKSFLK